MEENSLATLNCIKDHLKIYLQDAFSFIISRVVLEIFMF